MPKHTMKKDKKKHKMPSGKMMMGAKHKNKKVKKGY